MIGQDVKRILLFLYGSGLASSLFSCKFTESQKLSEIADKMDIASKLESRIAVSLHTLTTVYCKKPTCFEVLNKCTPWSGIVVTVNDFHVKRVRNCWQVECTSLYSFNLCVVV